MVKASNKANAAGVAKPVKFAGTLLLAVAILLPVGILLPQLSRFDAGLWVSAAILIAAILAVGIPLAAWRYRAEQRPIPPPWPTPTTTSRPVLEQSKPQMMSLRGGFTWSSQEFARMRKAWLQHTPAGRNHRKSVYSLSAVAVAGTAAACVWLLAHHLEASLLLLASAALFALLFSGRIRESAEVRAQAKVSWELLPSGILLQTGDAKKELPWKSIRAILRTRDGFLLWPDDLFETWLPVNAFGSLEDVETFAGVARAQVGNYTDSQGNLRKG